MTHRLIDGVARHTCTLLSSVVILMASACGGSAPSAGTVTAPHGWLAPAQWAPDNHRLLNAWLANVSRSETPVTAVFDWDNTCIFGDIGEATFRHQLSTLRLKMSPAELAMHVPASVDGITTLASGVSLATLRDDILASYHMLWPTIQAGQASTVLGSPAHKDFRVRLAYLYSELTDTDGIGARFSYPWVTGFAAGMTVEEVHDLAAETIAAARQEARATMTWRATSPGRSGVETFTYNAGLCPQAELVDLMRAASKAGVEVFVITASLEYVVEGAAQALGYPVDEAHVFGMRPKPAEDGTLTIFMDAAFPITYRAGKVAVIMQHLPAPPQLVAGDSNTDYEMLTHFDATRLRLVINRNKSGDIRTLYTGERARNLLQGRDENHCRLRPARETIRLGERQPTPVP